MGSARRLLRLDTPARRLSRRGRADIERSGMLSVAGRRGSARRRTRGASLSMAGPVPAAPDKVMITASIMLSSIMTALDSTIANVALPHMQGSLSASADQITWVLTSYIVSAAIMTPLSGWLARVFSIRIYLLTNAILFLVFSAACALAQDLPQMIALRAVQGFTGGGLIPMAFTLIITLLLLPPVFYFVFDTLLEVQLPGGTLWY